MGPISGPIDGPIGGAVVGPIADLNGVEMRGDMGVAAVHGADLWGLL